MQVYISHASSFDYKSELYLPLRESRLNQQHDFILPHEQSAEPFHAKTCIQGCDLIIAEVSWPSTGQGIELGWADDAGKPIYCLHKPDHHVSSSLQYVAQELISYESIIAGLERAIQLYGEVKC